MDWKHIGKVISPSEISKQQLTEVYFVDLLMCEIKLKPESISQIVSPYYQGISTHVQSEKSQAAL